MNWVGGARSRIKQQSEKKQQREYFERKRYQGKVQYRDRSEDKTQCGISQDLISFRTVEKAHSTPINRDACERRVKVVDIDGLASKDPLKSHRKSIYDGLNRNVELPSSPSKYPSLLQILGAGDFKENVPDCPTIKDTYSKNTLFAMENTEMPLENKTRRKNSGINVLQTHSTAENCVDPFSPYTTPAPGTHKDKDTSRLGIASRPLKSLENTSTLNLQSKRNAPFISDNHFEIPAKRQIYATEDFQDSHKIKSSVLDSAKQKNVKFYSPIEQKLLINFENFSTSEVDQKPSIQDYDSHAMRKREEQNKEDLTTYHRRLSELFGQRESNKVQTVFDEENQKKSRLVRGQHNKTSRKRKPSSRPWRLNEDTRVENKPAHSTRKPASVENTPNINSDGNLWQKCDGSSSKIYLKSFSHDLHDKIQLTTPNIFPSNLWSVHNSKYLHNENDVSAREEMEGQLDEDKPCMDKIWLENMMSKDEIHLSGFNQNDVIASSTPTPKGKTEEALQELIELDNQHCNDSLDQLIAVEEELKQEQQQSTKSHSTPPEVTMSDVTANNNCDGTLSTDEDRGHHFTQQTHTNHVQLQPDKLPSIHIRSVLDCDVLKSKLVVETSSTSSDSIQQNTEEPCEIGTEQRGETCDNWENETKNKQNPVCTSTTSTEENYQDRSQLEIRAHESNKKNSVETVDHEKGIGRSSITLQMNKPSPHSSIISCDDFNRSIQEEELASKDSKTSIKRCPNEDLMSTGNSEILQGNRFTLNNDPISATGNSALPPANNCLGRVMHQTVDKSVNAIRQSCSKASQTSPENLFCRSVGTEISHNISDVAIQCELILSVRNECAEKSSQHYLAEKIQSNSTAQPDLFDEEGHEFNTLEHRRRYYLDSEMSTDDSNVQHLPINVEKQQNSPLDLSTTEKNILPDETQLKMKYINPSIVMPQAEISIHGSFLSDIARGGLLGSKQEPSTCNDFCKETVRQWQNHTNVNNRQEEIAKVQQLADGSTPTDERAHTHSRVEIHNYITELSPSPRSTIDDKTLLKAPSKKVKSTRCETNIEQNESSQEDYESCASQPSNHGDPDKIIISTGNLTKTTEKTNDTYLKNEECIGPVEAIIQQYTSLHKEELSESSLTDIKYNLRSSKTS